MQNIFFFYSSPPGNMKMEYCTMGVTHRWCTIPLQGINAKTLISGTATNNVISSRLECTGLRSLYFTPEGLHASMGAKPLVRITEFSGLVAPTHALGKFGARFAPQFMVVVHVKNRRRFPLRPQRMH